MKQDTTQELKRPLPCIDRILECDKGERALAERTVLPSEDYFIDHFENYAVLPGVLQLEGLVQTASWLVRMTEDFARSQIRMTQCSQAKYSQLVRPGAKIEFEVHMSTSKPHHYQVRGKVREGDKTVATARFELISESLEDLNPKFAHLEPLINNKNRKIFNSISS